MDIKQHTTPEMLEKYSFLWSEVRLVIAAVALFIGGIPPILFLKLPSGLTTSLLTLCWIISGVAAVYLLYRWNEKKTLFGAKVRLDTYAFFIMVVSGINLGIVGIFGRNIGMSIASSRIVFFAVGVAYLVAAYHLHRRWKANGGKIF